MLRAIARALLVVLVAGGAMGNAPRRWDAVRL